MPGSVGLVILESSLSLSGIGGSSDVAAREENPGPGQEVAAPVGHVLGQGVDAPGLGTDQTPEVRGPRGQVEASRHLRTRFQAAEVQLRGDGPFENVDQDFGREGRDVSLRLKRDLNCKYFYSW